jgi:uncharacterized membrane protein YqhA
MGHVDFGDLKVKLLTSIVAISAIHVLESFMSIGPASDIAINNADHGRRYLPPARV